VNLNFNATFDVDMIGSPSTAMSHFANSLRAKGLSEFRSNR